MRILKGIAMMLFVLMLGWVPESDIPEESIVREMERTPYTVIVADGDIHEGVYAAEFVEEFSDEQ